MRHQRFLRYADEVVRQGSIRRAAEVLNVTASALNRRIMDLEQELGAPLFERLPRGMRLTAAGELFIAFARRQLAASEHLQSQIEELKGMRRGTVRIAASQALAHDFLAEVMADFRQSYPLVSFDILIADHERAAQALASYEVDLVLVFSPPLLQGFRPLFLLPQRLMALMAADHPLAARKQVRLSDCIAYPLALPVPSIHGRQLLDRVAASHGITLSPAVESNSFELLRAAVMRGETVSFQFETGASPDSLARSAVTARPMDPREGLVSNLVLGQLSGRAMPIAVAMFCEVLTARLESMAVPGAPATPAGEAAGA